MGQEDVPHVHIETQETRKGLFLLNTRSSNAHMNGRLDKVAMTAYIMRMKTGLDSKQWYPEWDDRQRGRTEDSNNVLERLDEYWQ